MRLALLFVLISLFSFGQELKVVRIYFGPKSLKSTEYSINQLSKIESAYNAGTIEIIKLNAYYTTDDGYDAPLEMSRRRISTIMDRIGIQNVDTSVQKLPKDTKIYLPNVEVIFKKGTGKKPNSEISSNTIDTVKTYQTKTEPSLKFDDIDTTWEKFGESGDSTRYGRNLSDIPEMSSKREKEYRLSQGDPIRPNNLFQKKSTLLTLQESYEKKKDYILKIAFKRGSETKMTEDSKVALDELSKFMLENPEAKILIRGHVCCVPKKSASKKRAEAVRDHLIKEGIDSKRMKVKGMSNKEPVVWPEETEADRQQNRRVDIRFLN